MEYVRSNRGAFKLIHGNHVYVKQKVLKNGAVCWECEQRRNKVACKAKLHVLNDQIVKNVNEHTHPANRGEVDLARAGHPAEPQRRRYQDSNQRIKNIVQDYPNRNIMQYLRGLAHNISMWRTLLLMFSALCHPKTAFLKATKWPKFAITMHYLCTYLYFVKFVLVYIVTLSP